MQRKFTLALGALFLSLAAAIHAAPLLETRHVVELPEARDLLLPDADLEERSILDLSDEEDLITRDVDDDLEARDMLDDPLEELAVRGPARAAQNKKKAEKKKKAKDFAKKNPAEAAAKKAEREADRIAKGRPLPGRGPTTSAPRPSAPKVPGAAPGAVTKANSLKGPAMQAHIAAQRAAKNAAKNAQRGAPFAGTKKAQKSAERKENRAAAKKQQQRLMVSQPGSQLRYNQAGQIVHKNTPKGNTEVKARAAAKLVKKAAYQALSPEAQLAKANAQHAKVALDLSTKDARREARIATKKAARDARKLDTKNQMTQARDDYTKSLATGTFPDRTTNYNTPQGKHYTGRDVRQALFNGHAAGQTGKGVGYNFKSGKEEVSKHPKVFGNRPNVADGQQPIPGMVGDGREFGMTSGSVRGYDGRSPNPTEARLITKANGAGVHEFQGVVAHPTKTGAARNDHVKVEGTP